MNETVTMKDKVIAALREFGLPRLIITGFLVLLLITFVPWLVTIVPNLVYGTASGNLVNF